MSIKTVTFAKNGHGIDSIKIDTTTQTVYSGCRALPPIAGLHYQLLNRGTRISIKNGAGGMMVQADIKSIK